MTAGGTGPATAVSLDAMGTVLHLDRPVARLRDALARRLALDVPLDRCAAALRVEMRHYRAHCRLAYDRAALARLRVECADVLAGALDVGADGAAVLPCLLDAIRYTAYPDAAPALHGLRRAGARIAVVSNWDVALHAALEVTRLAPLVDVAVTSAEVGVEKPDPGIFRHALDRLGVPAAAAVHVGDDPVLDVDGARAAGLGAVLLQRDGAAPSRTPAVADLTALAPLLAGGAVVA